MATPALTEQEITDGLAQLTGWEREGDMLVKTYTLPSYMAGLAFATAAGTVAEAHDHHPDIHIGWKKVTLRFTTHDAGHRLSAKDFATAAAVDALGYPKA
jgi:4a-hydroxytetrahydrobiopterin dehydratase